MDKQAQHSALDDYFASMLSVAPAPAAMPQASNTGTEPTIAVKPELKAELKLELKAESAIADDFKMPEPDGSGSLTDLDQLLGSVIDIDLADIHASVSNRDEAVIEVNELDVSDVLTVGVTEKNNSVAENEAINTFESECIDTLDVELKTEPKLDISVESVVATELENSAKTEPEWKNVELEANFQALFFEVAGVTFAVPLTELGGIHQIETVNSLFGKPDWFLGIMQHREQKLSVVDTALWVMPEQDMGKIDYKYQIQLSQSNWVLGCESLHGTETLNNNDIKWRSTPGSRPWLAGMVKSRMCVLLHVTEMIKLLDNGINIHGQ